jgi:hypothetical protein
MAIIIWMPKIILDFEGMVIVYSLGFSYRACTCFSLKMLHQFSLVLVLSCDLSGG